jgi:hypothetical protein
MKLQATEMLSIRAYAAGVSGRVFFLIADRQMLGDFRIPEVEGCDS